MKTRLLIIISFLALLCTPANAVLKEKNLDQTLSILREELTNYHYEQEKRMEFIKKENEEIRNQIMSIMEKSNQNGLMLYSQKSDYIFDLTYACHEATEQYKNFSTTVLPFRNATDKLNTEIGRYDSLINVLSGMPLMMLSNKAKIDRNVCLTLATDIRNTMQDNCESEKKYEMYYGMVGRRLRSLNDYANKRYNSIQNNIFINGDDSYFSILAKFNSRLHETKQSVLEKYQPMGKAKSQWDSKFVFGLFMIMFFYGIISVFLNILFIKYLMPKRLRTDDFVAKRPCIIMASSVITFAIILGIIRMTVNQNFLIMASNLLVEYSWLLGVILMSLLLRLNGDQIKSGFRIYSPLILIGFIVITFRITLTPNDMVNMLFPPILLICMLWQWNVISRHNQNIPRSDIFYTWITLLVFVCSVIASWMGYTLMSVQLLIWWIMQLTCIQTITCVTDWLRMFAAKKRLTQRPVSKTWLYYFILQVVIPSLSVAAFILSIYWAADVFNLSDLCWSLFKRDFVSEPNICISILRLSMVTVVWFLFSYISRISKAFLRLHYEKKKSQDAQSRKMMGKNLIQAVVWMVYLLIALNTLNIGSKWLMVIAAGFSTGIGFASKDILENIYYGISLMAGRVHVGDYIECDGTRGVVTSISYTSTMVESVDGSVIAFQNSQLFTKNYKNLTRNHGYELSTIPVSVGYGCNIPEVKKILIDAISKLDCYDKNRGINVIFSDFGDSSVNLKISCWVSVQQKVVAQSEIRECVYKTLNDHNIEIPFPQQDIYIKNMDVVNK
jgi:small-conductance mechanosensitive channel